MLRNSLLKHWSYRIIAPGLLLRQQYSALKKLLQYDIRCHQQLVELQEILYSGQCEDFAGLRDRCQRFSSDVLSMVNCLVEMAPDSCADLVSYHKKFEFYIRYLLAPPRIETSPPFTFSLYQLYPSQTNIGKKANNLALVSKELNMSVPNGFAVTSNGYHAFIKHNDLRQAIDEKLSCLNIDSEESLKRVSSSIIGMITSGTMPKILEDEILLRFQQLREDKINFKVAVRSSAMCEDNAGLSFAGQFLTKLNVHEAKLIDAYIQVLASKYSPEALYYRIINGLGDEETAMSVLIVEMVRPVTSGVIYTRNLQQDYSKDIQIYAVAGGGEKLVSGKVTPHQFLINRDSEKINPPDLEEQELLTHQQVKQLAEFGILIEKHFNLPQDIEWAIDENGSIFILQARPLQIPNAESCFSSISQQKIDLPILLEQCEVAAQGIGVGLTFVYNGRSDSLKNVPPNSVLITEKTPPELVRSIHKFSAVLSEKGSRASHFATVAREFNIPFLCSIDDIKQCFLSGMELTVDGNKGIVYDGRAEFEKQGDQIREHGNFQRVFREVLQFITPLELTDPSRHNFTPEGCRSMHDIIRYCHEMALQSIFSKGKPGTGYGSLRLIGDIPLDVYLFDVGDGIAQNYKKEVPLQAVTSLPFQALWKGLSHPDVQWKQKPFDWEAFDKIELSGAFVPKNDSFAFASYAVVGADYLHFNLRFGYHFTIIDVICGDNAAHNHCMLRFAGGGGNFEQKNLRLDFIELILLDLNFSVERKGDLLEAKLLEIESNDLQQKIDIVGRLLGASKLMDMVLDDDAMVVECVQQFNQGQYSFSEQG